jgi:cell division ATPase FtsA
VVRANGDHVEIGPDSVGYEITQRALVFGGDTLTATDLAVAAGMYELGDVARARAIERHVVEAGIKRIFERAAEVVDRVKTSAEPLPVVVVGGGSILLPDAMEGASRVVKPDHFAVANAIGAAIAQVGGEVDRVFSLEGMGREQAIGQARKEAEEKAVTAGADPSTVNVVDVEEVPLAYLPSNAVRIRVKAVGDLRLGDGRGPADN